MWKVKPSTMIIATFIVIIFGALMLATTAYQELEEYQEETEQPHMTPIVKQRWIWKTRAPYVTMVGAVLLGVGVVTFVVLLVLIYMEDLT